MQIIKMSFHYSAWSNPTSAVLAVTFSWGSPGTASVECSPGAPGPWQTPSMAPGKLPALEREGYSTRCCSLLSFPSLIILLSSDCCKYLLSHFIQFSLQGSLFLGSYEQTEKKNPPHYVTFQRCLTL